MCRRTLGQEKSGDKVTANGGILKGTSLDNKDVVNVWVGSGGAKQVLL